MLLQNNIKCECLQLHLIYCKNDIVFTFKKKGYQNELNKEKS